MTPVKADAEEANNFINEVFGRVTAMSALRCVIELGLLEHIPLERAVSIEHLASRTGAPEETVRRLLLPLTAMEIVTSPSPHHYAHTSLSAALRDKNVQGYFTFGWDHIMPSFNNAHKWFKVNNWREPTTINDCAFSVMHNGQGLFQYLDSNPHVATNFNMMNEHMQFPVNGIYPFHQLPAHAKIVDIGGGKGQACAELLSENPMLEGRIVLQDQEDVLKQVPPDLARKLELMPHNFFEPQPVRDAAIYHIRRIMCDWPDRECSLILQNTAHAMSASSRLLINGFVVPEQDCHPLIAGMDMSTMIYAGKERTLRQFEELFAQAGLQLVKIWNDDSGLVTIIEAKRGRENKL